jgi:hypothetical protein
MSTSTVCANRPQPSPWLLADEHRHLAQPAGTEDWSGQPPRRSVATLPTGDGQVTATVLSDGAVLVARLQPARSAASGRRVQVSVVARGVSLDALGIGEVADLQPFWDRRGPWLTRLAAAHEAAAAELAALAVPSGLDALRALIDASIAQADHLRQEQDGPPHSARVGATCCSNVGCGTQPPRHKAISAVNR